MTKKNLRLTFARFLVFFNLLTWNVALYAQYQQDIDIPARTMFIELNKVKGAHGYDIYIRAKTQKWAEPYKFRIKGEKLRLRLTPGIYEIRTRSLITENKDSTDIRTLSSDDVTTGPWSPWREFPVKFREAKILYPSDGAKIDPLGSQKEKIVFEWPSVKTARAYNVKIKDETGKVIESVSTTNTWLPVELSVNSNYQWALQPLSDIREGDSAMADPSRFHPFQILKPQPGLRTVFFEVHTARKGIRYEFEYIKFISPTETNPPSYLESRESEFRARLAPGKYEVRVRSIDANNIKSDWSAPEQFFVELFKPKIIRPMREEIIEPDGVDSSVRMKWVPWKGDNIYEVTVYDKDNKEILRQRTPKNYLDADLPADRTYTWSVKAYLPGENNRAIASEEPQVPGGENAFRIKEFSKLYFNSAEEPSNLYAWGRYIVSNISYVGINYDNDVKISQTVFGGSGDLGLGYWKRKTDYGLLGHAALSGFTASNGKSWTYADIALLAGYRKKLDNGARLRFWFGPRYSELPEIYATLTGDAYYVTKLKSFGPELQVSYMQSINDRYGWHAYGMAYYSVFDAGGVPTNEKQVPQLSFQLGLLATYRLSPNYIGMVGYTYKSERAAYNAGAAAGGGLNTIDYSGHYINLILEFGLSRPEEPDTRISVNR